MAKVPVAKPINPPPAAPALVFSGPQFFVALIAGVLMAFAFQFLLTNLGIAAKISDADTPVDLDADDESGWGRKIRKVESKIGFWTLLSVNIALFTACFLAVKLTFINNAGLGAIIGVVIWSAYFLLLVWASSSAIGSVVGSVANTASSGAQGVMATAATALGAGAVNQQIVNTVEASVSAVRRELSSAIDPTSIRETVEDYVGDLQLPKLDIKEIRKEFQNLLNSEDVKSLAGSDALSNVNRQTFVDLVSSRTDLSKEDVNQIAKQLESVWQQVVSQQQQKNPTTQLLEFLKSATPDRLRSSDLRTQLGQLIGSGQDGEQQSSGLTNQAMMMGLNALVGTVLTRTDLSDLDVEKVSSQLQKLGSQVADKLPALKFNTIRADVENYILNSQPWHLNRETIKQEFKDVIYDPEAAPAAIRPLLEQVNRDYFVQLLNQRGNFTPEQVKEIAEQLEEIRQEVLETVRGAESEEQSQDLRSRVENYLRSTGKEELNPEGIDRDFTALLEDPEAGLDALRSRLGQFDCAPRMLRKRDTLVAILSSRQDISETDANRIIDRIEATRDSVLKRAERAQSEAKKRIKDIKHQAKKQGEEARKAVATAAWWLFGTAITSVAAAALAGAIAVGGLKI